MASAIGSTPPSPSAARAPERAGFTLLGAVLAMAVTPVLLLAMRSAMFMVGRVMPDAQSPAAASAAGAEAVEQIVTDLQYAIRISSRSGSVLEFTDADQQATVQTRVRILNRPEVT